MRYSRIGESLDVLNFLTRMVLATLINQYARFAGAIGIVVFGGYIGIVAFSAMTLPVTNWDILPYIAASSEKDHADPQSLHDYAYNSVKVALYPAHYRDLIDDVGGFRSHMAESATDFYSLLAMYRVKFLYVKLLSFLAPYMAPVTAIRAISAVSVMVIGLLTLLWLRADGTLALAPLVAALFNIARFGDLAIAGTPDLLCSASLLIAFYCFLRRFEVLSAVFFLLAFMARPDGLVVLAVLAVLCVIFNPRAWGSILGFVASLIAYFLITMSVGHPGWWPHLYFSSIELKLNMDSFDPPFSFFYYTKAFAKAVFFSVTQNAWIGAIGLVLGAWFVSDRAGCLLRGRAAVAFSALMLGILTKFFVFPIYDTRMYFPYIIPALILILVPLRDMWALAAGRDRITPV